MNIHNWENKIILVAEDENMNYLLIKEIFKKTKATLIRALDGFEAISMIEGNKNIDLVLMDVKMPNMNGYEATKIIKKIRDIPVIAQTAYAMAGEERESIKAGCDAYVTKPIQIKSFINLVAKFIDK